MSYSLYLLSVISTDCYQNLGQCHVLLNLFQQFNLIYDVCKTFITRSKRWKVL